MLELADHGWVVREVGVGQVDADGARIDLPDSG
jgi:hypothetical protein